MTSTPAHEFDDSPADARHLGLRVLRREHEGVLIYFERRADVKFIVESGGGSAGGLVMPVEPGFAKAGQGQSVEMVLFCPSESDWSLQISLQVTEIDRPESEECVDRWIGYHGPTTQTTWIRCAIDGGKTETAVFGPEEIVAPNALGRAEYPLIKKANADRNRLAAACKAHAAIIVADPQCVGVDPLGLDIKARFGIIRLEFALGLYADTPDLASREIERMLGRP